MKVKLIMNWDIKADREQDYFEFVVREWVPATSRLGLRMIGAWYSLYRREQDQPKIMAEAMADDLVTMRDILNSEDWENIHLRLLEYVDNYSHKVVYANGDFQL